MPTDRQQHRPLPRKAPRQARSVDTVGIIVEAAARILETEGSAGFNTNAVAKRAGVSVGSLYQYFPSKEALIGALIIRETSVLIAEAESALDAVNGSDAILTMIAACVAHQLRRPTLARLLDFEEARLPFDEHTQHMQERLEGITLEAILRPDIARHGNPSSTAQDVMAIIKGMVDAAGQRGEKDHDVLQSRVERAVFGFLVIGPTN